MSVEKSAPKSLKFFSTYIASLDPETVQLPAFSILSAMLTEACGPPEKLSLVLVERSYVLRMTVKLAYGSISFPEPSNFLGRMLNENEGSGKDQFLGDPDWLSEMQYNIKSAICPSFSSSMRRKKLAGSGNEIAYGHKWCT